MRFRYNSKTILTIGRIQQINPIDDDNIACVPKHLIMEIMIVDFDCGDLKENRILPLQIVNRMSHDSNYVQTISFCFTRQLPQEYR